MEKITDGTSIIINDTGLLVLNCSVHCRLTKNSWCFFVSLLNIIVKFWIVISTALTILFRVMNIVTMVFYRYTSSLPSRKYCQRAKAQVWLWYKAFHWLFYRAPSLHCTIWQAPTSHYIHWNNKWRSRSQCWYSQNNYATYFTTVWSRWWIGTQGEVDDNK